MPGRPAAYFFETIFQFEAKRNFQERKTWVAHVSEATSSPRGTLSLLFPHHLRCCWGASSLSALAADVTPRAAAEDAGGAGERGDGVGREHCLG